MTAVTGLAFSEPELVRSICLESFYDFLKEFWHVIVPEDPVWNWHIELMAEELQMLAERVFAGQPKKHDLIINVPPGSTKSLTGSIMFPAWTMARMPTVRHICGSHTYELVLDLSRKSRDVVASELYQACFPEIQLRDDQNTKGYWANTQGGSRFSCTVGGKTPTGFHGHFIIIDDPLDPHSAMSEADLAVANRWMRETLPSRKVDKAITPTILIMQRLHQCLLPGTLVRVPAGEKVIEGVREGDTVLGSNGWQKVLATSKTYYSGTAYGVQLYGHPTVCWTTDHHRYLTKRGWVRADELRHSDWVRFPVLPSKATKIPWPRPKTAPPPAKASGTFNGSRSRSIEAGELRSLVESGMSSVAIAEKLGVHRNTVLSYRHLYGIGRVKNSNPIFGRAHLDDPDFWRIVGYWLAEGCFVGGKLGGPVGIRFTFGSTEQDYVDDVVAVLGKLGVRTTQKKHGSVISVTVCCSQLAEWLSDYFGRGAHHKRLPDFVFGLSRECRRALLDGWMCGDGCTYKGGHSVSSASLALRHGFQELLLSLGIPAFLTGTDKPREIIGLPNRAFSSGRTGHVRYGQRSSQRPKAEMGEGCCWYKVLRIQTKDYTGPVYDITTPSHDFVVGNATVHNSDPTGAWLARGGKVKHICLPAESSFPVKPERHRKRYVDGLLDPVRLSREVLREAREDLGEYGFSGQFGQQPIPLGGAMFKTDRLLVDVPPTHFRQVVRYWDKAATKDAGAFTVGVKMGLDHLKRYWVLDVVRGQWSSDEREAIIRKTAEIDGKSVVIGLEQEPGSGGKESAQATVRNLAGFKVRVYAVGRSEGNKINRADPFSTQVNQGNVLLRQGAPWLEQYVEELRFFPRSQYKDQVDASSGAFNMLAVVRKKVGALGF